MSGGVRLSDPTLWTFRRRLWNSLNCSRIWLGNFGFFERPLKDGDFEALGSIGYESALRAKSLNAPIVPREAPQRPQKTIASRDAPSGFSILIVRLPHLPQTI
jgi:hypothetical protein